MINEWNASEIQAGFFLGILQELHAPKEIHGKKNSSLFILNTK